MIPIRDNIRSQSTPIVMYGLILLNIVIFFKELSGDNYALTSIIDAFGLRPADFIQGIFKSPDNWHLYVPLVTNLFLHGGWMHIIGNMWYLKIFGDNIEDRIGHGEFLFFYIFCGVVANITQITIDPTANIPVIGASGAISGVLGAYLVCFTWAKISTLIPIFFFFTVIDIPALVFLGLWFYLQLLSGTASPTSVGSNIAWWAHIGGFLAGMILIVLLPKRRYWSTGKVYRFMD